LGSSRWLVALGVEPIMVFSCGALCGSRALGRRGRRTGMCTTPQRCGGAACNASTFVAARANRASQALTQRLLRVLGVGSGRYTRDAISLDGVVGVDVVAPSSHMIAAPPRLTRKQSQGASEARKHPGPPGRGWKPQDAIALIGRRPHADRRAAQSLQHGEDAHHRPEHVRTPTAVPMLGARRRPGRWHVRANRRRRRRRRGRGRGLLTARNHRRQPVPARAARPRPTRRRQH
jgi:hypothetical protein